MISSKAQPIGYRRDRNDVRVVGSVRLTRSPGDTSLTVTEGDARYARLAHVHGILDVTGLQDALDAKEAAISSGSTTQYWRGDKSWQTLNKAAVGLGSVENTALSTWAGSSAITAVGVLVSGSIPVTLLTGTLPVVRGGTGISAPGATAGNLRWSGSAYVVDTASYALASSVPSASTTTPLVNGTAAVGTGTTWARADHVHPTDTSRQAASAVLTNVAAQSSGTGFLRLAAGVASLDTNSYALASAVPSASSTTPSAIGTTAVGTGTTWARADHVHALPATGVAAGSYGSATVVPVPTVDAYGRITAMATAAITPAGIGAAEASVVAYTGTGAVDPNTLTGLQSGYTQATAANRPGNYAFVQTLGRYNGGSMQIASDSYGSDSNSLWWRRKGDNGTWYPWKTIWHTGNLTQTALGGPFLPLSGGNVVGNLNVTGAITLSTNGAQTLMIGDDASLGDCDVAHTVRLMSQTNSNYGILRLGTADFGVFADGSVVGLRAGGSIPLYAFGSLVQVGNLGVSGEATVANLSRPISATNPTSISDSGRYHWTGTATCSLGAPTAGRMLILSRTYFASNVTLTTPSGSIIWPAGAGGNASSGSASSMSYGGGGLLLVADGTNWCVC